MNFLRRKVANEDGAPAPEVKQAETPTGDNDTCNDPSSSVGLGATVAANGGVNGEAVANGSVVKVGEGGTSEINAADVAKDVQKLEMEDEDGASQRLSTVSLTSNKDAPSPPDQPSTTQTPTTTPKGEPEKEHAADFGEESEGEYTDADSDSEYTYETESEDEGEQKKKGWFGFLGRRKKHTTRHDEEEEEEEYTESEEEEEVHDKDAAINGVESHKDKEVDINKSPKEADISQPQQQEEDEQSNSSEEGPTHPLLQSPEPPSPTTKQLLNTQPNSTTLNEQEEAILMAQAIQRVQQRIQNNGGNLYAALDEHDQKLVDSLKGVKDEETIREVVDKSMKEDERRKARGTAVDAAGEAGGDDFVNVEKESNGVNNVDIEPLAHAAPSSLNGDITKLEPPTLDREPSARMEPAAVEDGDSEQPSMDTEPSLHTEPSLDTEASLTGANSRAPAEPSAEATTGEQPIQQINTQSNLIDDAEDSDSEDEDSDDDEGEDEMPTVEDQRSLLSLGAEHDRVDVIKELLNDSPIVESLLAGVQGEIEREGGDESQHVVFVPPPLHAAVAHGSINAASCLLRMGADPSIRPAVPAQFLSHSYQPSPSKGGAEEDRNYRKYHEMSAWELAFGATIEIVEGEDDVDGAAENELEMAVKDEHPKRGWFGFGGSPTEEPTTIVEKSPCGKKRIKRKSPVTIAPQKLEGIKHAFTAEALRAIGSDEVNRLSQLLNAGMDSQMEVAGKTLVEWAKEMDAHGCCDLLGAALVEEEEEELHQGEVEHVEEQTEVPETAQEPVEEAAPEQPVAKYEIPQEPAFIPDERLMGMSITDIQMLVQENTNLIPTLTSCLADLTAETSITSSILHDVTSGGRGGISSPAFVDLVRALKDQRMQAEEASQSWQRAWEEREDELDFFWEEVLDDRMREELGPMLIQVSSDPIQQKVPPEMANSLEYWTKRFVEVDAHITKLRVSIAQLAQDSAIQTADIGKHGMSGALNLTKSIRDEIKEFERQLELAKNGEGMCRRKIESIQSRIVHNDPTYNVQPDMMETMLPPGEGAVEREQEHYPQQAPEVYSDKHAHPESEEVDVGMEDYQLRAIVQQQEESCEARSISPPAAVEHEAEQQSEDDEEVMAEEEHHKDLQYETTSDGEEVADEESVHEDTDSEEVVDDTPDLSQPDVNESSSGSYDIIEALDTSNEVRSIHEAVEEEDVDVDESNDIVEEEENVEVEQEEAQIEPPAVVEKPREVQPSSLYDWNDNDIVFSSEVSRQSQKPANATATTSTIKPSNAIAEGMSTAIVVHTTNLQASSLPSQIWEILRRIVGFGRVVRTERYDDNNNPHIMIV